MPRLGVKNTSQWSKDIDNRTNKAFVESFQAEYGRLPSLYASQGFDTANLLLSAMAKADVKDADAFREALEEADFKSRAATSDSAPTTIRSRTSMSAKSSRKAMSTPTRSSARR
jgi:ABC-type branched-subunit amino acid transport system substrate-binding protein